VGTVDLRKQRILTFGLRKARLGARSAEAHSLAGCVAGRTTSSVGAEALKERVAGVGRAVDVHDPEDTRQVVKRLELRPRRTPERRDAGEHDDGSCKSDCETLVHIAPLNAVGRRASCVLSPAEPTFDDINAARLASRFY